MGVSCRIDKEKDFTERYDLFEENAKKAKRFIVNGEYESALSAPLRGECTNLAYILLGDLCGEKIALQIVLAQKKYDYNSNDGLRLINGTGKAEGKFFLEQVKSVLASKLKDVDREERKGILSRLDNLMDCYNDCSPAAHGGRNRATSDLERTARVSYAMIPELLDRIDGHVSFSEKTKELHQKFCSDDELKLPYAKNEVVDNSERNAELANERVILNSELMDVAGGYAKAILVLPPDFANTVKIDICMNLLKMRWALVVDYNQHGEDGFFAQLPPELQDKFSIVAAPEESENNNYVADGIHRYNWLFAAGDKRNYKTLNRDSKKVRRFVVDAVKKLFTSNHTAKFVFFVFHNRPNKEFVDILNSLRYNIDLEDGFAENFEFLIFNGEDYSMYDEWNKKKERMEEDESCIVNLHLNVYDLLKAIEGNTTFSELGEGKPFSLNVNGKDISLGPKERTKYEEAGLEFVDVCKQNVGGYDFYAGDEITWCDLQNGEGVERSGFEDQKNRLIRKVKELKGVKTMTMLYEPGAGATTYSRQLVFFIDEKSRNSNDFQCTAVVVRRYVRSYLVNRLIDLSQRINNTPLLVLFESSILSESAFNDMVVALNEAQRNILFLRVLNKNKLRGKENDGQEYIQVGRWLNKIEKGKFITKYRDKRLGEEKVKVLVDMKELQAIDFPLMLHDGHVSVNLSSYIRGLMEDLPEELKNVCVYIAFVYKYTGKSLNWTLLQPLLNGKKRIDLWETKYQKIVKSILSEQIDGESHTNLWRPRYSVFSEFILGWYFDKESAKLKPSELFGLADSFIDICARYGNVLAEDDEDVLVALFTERNDEDFRMSDERSDNFVQKFSLLISELSEYDYVKSVMEKLVTVFPNNPYFLAHYARFLYEYVVSFKECDEDDKLFVKAEEYINRAVGCNDKNDKIYHMKGMLYLRRIQTMLNRMNKDKGNLNERLSLQSKLMEWVNFARDSFEKSEFYAPLSTYGYLAEGKVYREGLKVVKLLLGEKDYNFVEKDPWTEYVDGLNQVVLKLMDLSKRDQNRENDRLWDDFKNLRSYHMKVVGCSEDVVRQYYNKLEQSDMSRVERFYYTQMYYWAVIYCEKNKLGNMSSDTEILEKLSEDTRTRLERKLEQAIDKGCVSAFRQLHELKITGNGSYSIDDAILHWRRCVDKCDGVEKFDFDYMNACYMLASYYSARFIIAGLNGEDADSEDEKNAEKYYKIAKDEAHRNKRKSTISAYYYLGKGDDARVLLRADQPSVFRRWVDCRITQVGERSGKAIVIPCGLKASFRSVEFGQQDVGREIKRQIGFRYEGVGLYDRSYVEEKYVPQDSSGEKENEKSDDINENEKGNRTVVHESIGITSKNMVEGRCDNVELEVLKNDAKAQSRCHGIYHEKTNYSSAYLVDDNGLKREVRTQKDQYIEEGEEVLFVPKEEPHKKNPGKLYYTAYEVELMKD